MGRKEQPSSLLSVGSFNVRGLSSDFRRDTLRRDLKRHQIDICTLQETKLSTSVDTEENGYRLICPAPECRHYGLGFAVSSKISKNIQKLWILSDRVAVLTLQINPSNCGNRNPKTCNDSNQTSNTSKPSSTLAIINVYAPTSTICARNVEEADKFWATLRSAYDHVKSSTVVILAGDFNAKVGSDCQRVNRELCLGNHSRGKRNLSGQCLIDFCSSSDLFLCNTAFNHNARHITTWTGHRKDTSTNTVVPVYNQIDYVICKLSQKRLLVDSRSYGGCELFTDHKLVVARFDFQRLYGIFGRSNRTDNQQQFRVNTTKLSSADTRATYQQKLNDTLISADLTVRGSQERSLQDTCDAVLGVVKSVAEDVLGTAKRTVHKLPDPEIEQLSREQRSLRITIANTTKPDIRVALTQKRNAIQHTIREKCRANAQAALEEKAAEIEKQKNGAQMFKAVQLMQRRQSKKPSVQDNDGHFIVDDQLAATAIQEHFARQFRGDVAQGIEPFSGQPKSLSSPITKEEVDKGLAKLNNGRAAGPDEIPGELLKYGRESLAPMFAAMFNHMFEHHDPLDLGTGTLIPLQKPGKPVGPIANLRPIVLLSTLRKALSLITLNRIAKKVDGYLSLTQSGFRQGRSTADVVWSHRWFSATCQRYQQQITILGIDMSKAFDCIRRDRLLEVLQSFLNEDDMRLVRVLLATTSIQVQVGKATSELAETTIGTPQGDSLSPVLFIIYLEAALRDVRATPVATQRPEADSHLPFELEYADDADFVSTSTKWLSDLEPVISDTLQEWHLEVNTSKTEWTTIARDKDRVAEHWRSTRKLGSLIGDAEDVSRRKQLASAAFNSMRSLWQQRQHIGEKLRIRLYNAFVLPVLLYNSGTWGLTQQAEESLDSFHRNQLRSLLGIHWPQILPNRDLYQRCESEPISGMIKKSRWCLFGHILRLPEGTPAKQSMVMYFTSQEPKWRGRPRITLPVKLSSDATASGTCALKCLSDLHHLETLAKDRRRWGQLVGQICEC